MRNWKHIVATTIFGLLLAGVLVVAYLLGRKERSEIICRRIIVTVEDSLTTRFVTGNAVKSYLALEYRGLTGTPIDSIDLHRIEKILDNKSAIYKSQAFTTRNGALNIKVTQRKPAIEFKARGYGFYCDIEGYLFPLQANAATDIIVIEGMLPLDVQDCNQGHPLDPSDRVWLNNMLEFTRVINSEIFWKERIGRINCDIDGNLVINSKIGEEKFLLGKAEDIMKNLEKIRLYYDKIIPDKGEGTYETVDLRFKNQIICKKKEENI